jgi:hypothetical protein
VWPGGGLRKNGWARTWERLPGGVTEELPRRGEFSGTPGNGTRTDQKRVWGRMTFYGFVHSLFTFTADAPWVLLIREVGLPQTCQGPPTRGGCSLAMPPSHALTASARGRSRPCPSQMRRHNIRMRHKPGSFQLDNKQTNTTARASPPSNSHTPRSQVFMCFYTRTRVSIRHVHRFYQIVILRAPRSSRPVHPLLFSHRPPCQSAAMPFPAFDAIDIPGRPAIPFLLNHYSESLALSRHWLAVVRKHSLLADDRGCVSRAPMGGSTVP